MKISPLVDFYIRRKASKQKIRLDNNYRSILADIVCLLPDHNCKIVYSWIWDAGGHTINASATIPGLILINAEWAATIALHYDDEVVVDAFKMTLGHELTHQEGDYLFVEPFSNRGKFVYWVNEVHADYGGIVKAFDGDSVIGIRSLRYKLNCKGQNMDKDCRTHPSWARRIEYVSSHDFNEELVREIARIVRCSDELLIEHICGYYEDINLRR